ncbi:hypothetical protein AVT25_gp30 [Bacillus phage Pavlov]|uniref:hypothetical protein n=1 Tax=Bacillus phage Pavlov TaxID=1675598 RepID=UPI00065F5C11|nr:hypothetical protein AVT25_gp30 [Bacillus phage Pavlov]AKQ07451.1 hypothetical protein CPT_Pavlov30 [Bacillus phage Pavlov]
MKTVEEKLAEYISILEVLKDRIEDDTNDITLSDHSRALATGEFYTLKNVINKLKEIK